MEAMEAQVQQHGTLDAAAQAKVGIYLLRLQTDCLATAVRVIRLIYDLKSYGWDMLFV
jgi:hypothetical protein